MQGWRTIATVAVLVNQAAATSTVQLYNVSEPMYGACRLKGISESSDNFKYYASVSSKDYSIHEACARCITITLDDKSTSAYVLDVCDGCASGTLQISEATMAELGIKSTDSSTKVTYEFDTCPTSLMSGDVKACLMEGASVSYVPLQFYNSEQVITGATINGVTAAKSSSSFLFSADSGSSSSTWYKSIAFSVTSEDDDTLNGTFAFTSTSGCATSDVQFNSATTKEGVDVSSSGSSNRALIGGICGGLGALLIIVGSVIFVRRRKRSSKNLDDPEVDVEHQYLSPPTKPTPVLATSVHSDRNDHDSQHPPASPTVDYAESFSPAASSKALSSPLRDMSSHISSPVSNEISAAAVAANADSFMSSAMSDTSSVVSAPLSSVENPSSPEPVYTAPTYAYSNNIVTSPPRLSNVKNAPTLSAPVVPQRASTANLEYDDDVEERRSSFDIDNMREDEARATSGKDPISYDSQRSFEPYSADDPYVNTVTSPQSFVRATSLRRPNSIRRSSGHDLGRDSARITNNSEFSADSYASSFPRQTNPSILSSTGLESARSNTPPPSSYDSSRGRRNMEPDATTRDSYASVPASQRAMDLSASQTSVGSFRESGGYSRESLNILGYPYSKKSGRHYNTTG